LAKSKPPAPSFSDNWSLYLGVALCSGIGHVFVVMVGHLYRTPHLAIVIISNTRYLWTVPLTIFVIESKSKYKIFHGFTLFALVALLAAIGYLVVPIIAFENLVVNSTKDTAVYCIVFLIGTILISVAPLFIEKFFIQRKRLAAGRSGTFDIFMLCMWISIFQFIVVFLFFWMDLIPIVGSTGGSAANFLQIIRMESTCLFQFGYCPDSVWMGFMFVLSWYVETLFLIKLAQDSTNYIQVVSTVSFPLIICFWIAFPYYEITDPSIPREFLWQSMPTWSVLPALLFFIIGSFVFKLWEMRQSSLIRPTLAY